MTVITEPDTSHREFLYAQGKQLTQIGSINEAEEVQKRDGRDNVQVNFESNTAFCSLIKLDNGPAAAMEWGIMSVTVHHGRRLSCAQRAETPKK